MKYTIGVKLDSGVLALCKVWKGETAEQAASVQGFKLHEPARVFSSKKEAEKELRKLLGYRPKKGGYRPDKDTLISEVGKFHPGDGHAIHVRIRNNGDGARVQVVRTRMVAGTVLPRGSMGRLKPGAARRLAKLLENAAALAEASDSRVSCDSGDVSD